MADFEDFTMPLGSAHPSVLTTLGSSIYNFLSERPLLLFGLAILVTVFATRLTTSSNKSESNGSDGATTIPRVPYYFPLLGHIPNMAHDATTFTRNLRSAYSGTGAYSLNFFGTVHNVLFAPPLATALLNTSTSNAQSDEVFKGIMGKVFGWPVKTESEKYDAFLGELNALYKNFTGEPGLSEMTRRTALRVKETIGDFVTFSESLVDQMLWERCSNSKVKTNAQGERVMEVDLLQLVRDWCARTANPSIIGSDFINNFPNFFEELWTLDQGFLLLATGLPRWFPIPLLTRAHIARKNILDQLEVFERAMEKHFDGKDAGAEWRDLDDVGPVVRGRQDIYRKYDISMRARAATEHALMWAANANSNSLVFWMLERIYADKVLLAMLREEIAPYVRAAQQDSGFAISEMPRLEEFDVEGLCANCPLLKSCYIECLRVDTASWSLKVVRQDFVLSTRDKEAQKWMLKKGEYVHVAHDLHNTDPNVFEHPDMWKPDRHVKYENGKAIGADMGSIRPYGGGHSMCKGRAFAFKECMMFAAAIITLWEIEPVGGGQWKMPAHKKATGVYATSDSTRVWIKKRELPKA